MRFVHSHYYCPNTPPVMNSGPVSMYPPFENRSFICSIMQVQKSFLSKLALIAYRHSETDSSLIYATISPKCKISAAYCKYYKRNILERSSCGLPFCALTLGNCPVPKGHLLFEDVFSEPHCSANSVAQVLPPIIPDTSLQTSLARGARSPLYDFQENFPSSQSCCVLCVKQK